ncbi:MAG: ABC transporter ATP-binding protein/permease [Acetobacter sp.]|nr:ABC transporter ATP-binding protein/permease [Bacteroides sp.]MCM1340784.1 ABC transporter ATP-binding protein/permease [Acetobacter sp.]MCM1432659.1 ABC transporter ATP-binding protein/permease [Clostridiales bacterium]
MDNFKYMIKNWLTWDRKSLIYFIIKIPALVLQPIITAYIPKVMIDCITDGVTINRLIIIIAMLSLLITLITWLDPFMNELLIGSSNIIRMRYSMEAFRKNLYTDYINIESLEGRKRNKEAAEFYRSSYSPAASFIDNLGQIFVCIVGVITSMALLYKINIFMILTILISCAIEFFLLRFLHDKELVINKTRSRTTVKFYYFYNLSKDTSASKDIKLYNFEDYFTYTLAKIISNLEKITKQYGPQSFKVSSVRALLNFIRELVAYSYLVYLTYNGSIKVSDFIFFFGIISGFSNWIVKLVGSISRMEYCCKSCGLYRNYIEDDLLYDNKNKIDFKSIESIEFDNVSFKYPNADNNTLHNISFKIEKGENIAIIGENGAGKTTIIKLLCGLYDATEGSILVNNRDITLYSKDSYFDLFSVVFQDYFFMPMSIAENISVDKNFSKERIYSAFEKAGILEKIESLKDKENTPMIKDIYKEAAEFSGGEKQKLLLAKAIYKNAPILILDEPTAALDPIAERELYQKYNEITKDKISFFISHRLSSTVFCDKILFVSDGKITEVGTHAELMSLKGAYYRMFQAQSYYYKEMNVNHE